MTRAVAAAALLTAAAADVSARKVREREVRTDRERKAIAKKVRTGRVQRLIRRKLVDESEGPARDAERKRKKQLEKLARQGIAPQPSPIKSPARRSTYAVGRRLD